MFGSRLLVNMACRSVFRPTFKITQSFASMVPLYTETSSLLGRVNGVPSNLLVRNLREIIMRAEEDMEIDIDINCPSQLSLLVQGKIPSIPSSPIMMDNSICLYEFEENRQDSENNHAENDPEKMNDPLID